MNKSQKISLFILYLLWSVTSLILLSIGLWTLLGHLNGWISFYMVIALIAGILKGYFVIGKAAKRMILEIHELSDNTLNSVFGWAIAMSWKGFVLLFIMIMLGKLLGGWLEIINPSYRALLRIFIGSALGIASWYFLAELRGGQQKR